MAKALVAAQVQASELLVSNGKLPHISFQTGQAAYGPLRFMFLACNDAAGAKVSSATAKARTHACNETNTARQLLSWVWPIVHSSSSLGAMPAGQHASLKLAYSASNAHKYSGNIAS